jgi:hypothetical protein
LLLAAYLIQKGMLVFLLSAFCYSIVPAMKQFAIDEHGLPIIARR